MLADHYPMIVMRVKCVERVSLLKPVIQILGTL